MNKLLLLLLIVLAISCRKDEIQNEHIGFTLSNFEDHDFNKVLFSEYLNNLNEGLYGNINSIVVIHEDELVKELYFRGWERNDLIQIQSSTKSIASLLIGHAIDNNLLSLTDTMITFFSDYDINNMDTIKSSITIKDMLTMSAGLEWDESSVPYNTPGNTLTDMYNETENFIPYLLNLPMSDMPGEKFVYNSGISYLLGAILEISTGEQVENYCTKNLLEPLDIPKSQWVAYNDGGLAHCGGGLFLRSIDMAKIGSLIINKGKWKGMQVISENWISESVKERQTIVSNLKYGYQWWIYNPPYNMQNIIIARGYGWRNIHVIPELDMVVVTTGDNNSNSTVFSELQILLDILSCSPKYQEIVIAFYEQQMNTPERKISPEDILWTANYLNQYKEYQKTINFLSFFESYYSKNYELLYTFHFGNALFNINNYEEARKYLEKHISINQQDGLNHQYYYEKASEMLETINSN